MSTPICGHHLDVTSHSRWGRRGLALGRQGRQEQRRRLLACRAASRPLRAAVRATDGSAPLPGRRWPTSARSTVPEVKGGGLLSKWFACGRVDTRTWQERSGKTGVDQDRPFARTSVAARSGPKRRRRQSSPCRRSWSAVRGSRGTRRSRGSSRHRREPIEGREADS
jgi:hypothetical protein